MKYDNITCKVDKEIFEMLKNISKQARDAEKLGIDYDNIKTITFTL